MELLLSQSYDSFKAGDSSPLLLPKDLIWGTSRTVDTCEK